MDILSHLSEYFREVEIIPLLLEQCKSTEKNVLRLLAVTEQD